MTKNSNKQNKKMSMKKELFSMLALLMTAVPGAWADDDPQPINLTSTDGKEWTLASMPAYDVELEVTYYTDSELTSMAVDAINALPNPDQVTLRSLYKKTIFHQASFIKTTLLKNKPYDETLRSASDWKWFLHTLIFENKTYNHLPIIIARFEGGGFSEKESEVGQNEVIQELQHMLPERIRQDYEDYCFGTSPYRKMMNQVESVPKLKKLIYQIDIKVLKLLNIIIKAKWIKEL